MLDAAGEEHADIAGPLEDRAHEPRDLVGVAKALVGRDDLLELVEEDDDALAVALGQPFGQLERGAQACVAVCILTVESDLEDQLDAVAEVVPGADHGGLTQHRHDLPPRTARLASARLSVARLDSSRMVSHRARPEASTRSKRSTAATYAPSRRHASSAASAAREVLDDP
ncbi:MAG TPA: hypothetical protein VGR11_07780 [Solirubrobacteraceae bacterium]|nr:hypothetical protein [Solirubrobacteraceae bacterium]